MKYVAILLVSSIALACATRQATSQTPAPAPGSSAEAHAMMGPGMMGHGQSGMGQGMMGHGQGGMMSHEMMGPGMGENCPMALEGTTVRSEEVAGGASIVFSTTGDVTELRRRVAAMVDMHNKHPGGCGMMAMHAKGSGAPGTPSAPPGDHAAHHPETQAK